MKLSVAVLIPCLLALLGAPSPAPACGPYYGKARLAWLGANMLDTPWTTFETDIAQIAASSPPPPGVVALPVRTCQGVSADLTAALGDRPDAAEIVARWTRARCEGDRSIPADLAASVPREFALYAEGVQRMYADDLDGAYQRWEELLALPAPERHWRSTWAAYMLAITAWQSTGAPPSDWARVQALAAAGFADSLGLAAASLRHESWAHHLDGQPQRALRTCLGYLSAGGGLPHSCKEDLSDFVKATLDGSPAVLAEAASDPRSAEAIAAWLTSGRGDGPDRARRAGAWLAAVDRSGTTPRGSRLAQIAYQEGRFETAAAWAARAEPLDPMGHWVKAKLALRAGDPDAAIAAMRTAATLFGVHTALPFTGTPEIRCRHRADAGSAVRIELGILLVSQGRYEEATSEFLAARDWLDASWVAERLLGTDELQRYVDQWFSDGWWRDDSSPAGIDLDIGPEVAIPAMRHLLARRLAREGRWDEALRYYPTSARPAAEQLRAALLRGRDGTLPDAERGAALWEAAMLAKAHGWDLLATEADPDFRNIRGSSWAEDVTEARLAATRPGYTVDLRDIVPNDDIMLDTFAQFEEQYEPFERDFLLPPTPDELARISAHAPRPEQYQFVYTAWDLAREAVQLLPDDSALLAEVACTAGTWMRYRDVDRSSRMWLTLLRRAYHTPTGREAQARAGWWGLDETGRCSIPEPAPEASRGCSDASMAGLMLLPLTWLRRRTIRTPRPPATAR